MLRTSDRMAMTASSGVLALLAAGVMIWSGRAGEATHQASKAAPAAVSPTPAAQPLARQLSALAESVPPMASLEMRLSGLHAALGRNGLHLVSSEYKLVPSREGQWARVEVSLVIDGPYYAMRLFLRGLMASDAFTALQAADFQRVAASAAAPSVVRCRLTLLLFTAEANHKALPP